jgi:hypothetical protein
LASAPEIFNVDLLGLVFGGVAHGAVETVEELADFDHADVRDFFLQVVGDAPDARGFFLELVEEIGQLVHHLGDVRADFHEAARQDVEIVVLIELQFEEAVQEGGCCGQRPRPGSAVAPERRWPDSGFDSGCPSPTWPNSYFSLKVPDHFQQAGRG